jgi:hypothetical protein
MERHGEMGTLFEPKIHLTREELILLCEFSLAAPPYIHERSDGVALLNKIAKDKGYSQTQCDNAIAALDEIYLRSNPPGGEA